MSFSIDQRMTHYLPTCCDAWHFMPHCFTFNLGPSIFQGYETLQQMPSHVTTLHFFHPFSPDPQSGGTTTGPGTTGDEDARLGLQRLDIHIYLLIDQGSSQATRAVYRSGWQRYTSFGTRFHLRPLPLTEHTLCQFAASLVDSVSWGTIRRSQISQDQCWPSTLSFPRLDYLLKGIRKRSPDHARSRRLPITPDLLLKMYVIWAQPPLMVDKAMLWAA